MILKCILELEVCFINIWKPFQTVRLRWEITQKKIIMLVFPSLLGGQNLPDIVLYSSKGEMRGAPRSRQETRQILVYIKIKYLKSLEFWCVLTSPLCNVLLSSYFFLFYSITMLNVKFSFVFYKFTKSTIPLWVAIFTFNLREWIPWISGNL